MNNQNHINEEHLASSTGERFQYHPADDFNEDQVERFRHHPADDSNAEQFLYNREARDKPPVMSKLQVWVKVLHLVFLIGLAVIAFITLPFYYALGAMYAVPLVMVVVWAAWQLIRGKA
jgi:hypothetical protein